MRSAQGNPTPNSFFDLPLTASLALEQGYVQPEETKDETLLQTLCLPDDERVCLLYDVQGTIAGEQISITKEVDNLEGMKVHPLDKGFKEITLFGRQVYAIRIFFVDQKTIENGGRVNTNTSLQSLWLTIKNQLTEIPMKESELLEKVPGYVKQNCFFRMGQHYFFNATETMQPDSYESYFILFDQDGNLSGLGLVMFGRKADSTPRDGQRPWFEDLVSQAVKMISPNTPDWVLKTIDEYGVYSHHMYFTAEPWKIQCPAGKQAQGKY